MHKEDISEERLRKAAEEMGMTFETFCEQMNTICREEEKERKNQGYAYSLSA